MNANVCMMKPESNFLNVNGVTIVMKINAHANRTTSMLTVRSVFDEN